MEGSFITLQAAAGAVTLIFTIGAFFWISGALELLNSKGTNTGDQIRDGFFILL
jgi:hypothetical protein